MTARKQMSYIKEYPARVAIANKKFPTVCARQQTSNAGFAPFRMCNGFTLVETIVAAVVAILLIVNLFALIVYAGMFRLKAKQGDIARTWIQQDLENVKFKASGFRIASLSAAASANATSVSVNRSAIGSIVLATGDALKIGTDSVLHTISSISSTTITFSPALSTDQLSGAQIWATGSSVSPKLCNAASTATGLAQALMLDLDPVVTSSKTISGVSYNLVRTPTATNVAPYQRLALTYAVVPSSGGSAILSLQTEVIPNAAFGCP